MMKIERNNAYSLKAMLCVVVKRMIPAMVCFLLSNSSFSQKINGQWRGYFNGTRDIVISGIDNTEYVLEIEINGSQVSGFSYSYFDNRRYYVICSLAGTYYKSTKSMKVTETARIKGVTPPDWNDCLQTHILTYEKRGDTELLAGRWVTAPGQLGDCGLGKTTLTRRTVSRDLSSYNKSKSGNPFSSRKTTPKTTALTKNTKKRVTPPPIAKNNTKAKPDHKTTVPPLAKNDLVQRDAPDIIEPEVKKQVVPIIPPENNFEKRSNELLKTIEIDHASFKVDLYDNGEIDGDSISLFYNGRLLLSHKRLSDKPISLTLDAASGKETNELIMYAENLGEIPPNTALMIVTDGDKRYEVRITSDLKKSGSIRFIHKSTPPPKG